MFSSFFVSGVDSKTDFPAESGTATLRSRLSCVNSWLVVTAQVPTPLPRHPTKV